LGIHDGVQTRDCTPRMGSYKSAAALADMLIKYHLGSTHRRFVASFADEKELRRALVQSIDRINKPKFEAKLKPKSNLWKSETITR
jgi:hypothetical protein